MPGSKFTVHFSGNTIETTVTDQPSDVDNWVNEIRSLRRETPFVVGLDCEWRPHNISSMSNKTSVLQLCSGNKCLVLQIIYMDTVPQSLAHFLSDSSVTFVGLGIDQDKTKLETEYGLYISNNAVDVGPLATSQMRTYCRPVLKEIAREIAGLNMEKPSHVTTSDWQARILDKAQVDYATIDAYVSYRIGRKLLNKY